MAGLRGHKSVSHCVDATLVFARNQPFNGLVGAILLHRPSHYSGLLLPVQRCSQLLGREGTRQGSPSDLPLQLARPRENNKQQNKKKDRVYFD